MKNIKKQQLFNLFNDFINIIFNGIWFSGIENYGKYKRWWFKQLWVDANYNKNGLLIDKYKMWYENGQIHIDVNYNKKGELNGEYKEWNENGDLIFNVKFKNNKLVNINYVNFDYDKGWFEYYDQIQDEWINFYNKIKKMYNNEKYKKKTN